MIGQTILHYKIESKIGEGGMGEVYLAEDTRLDRRVALKFLPSRVGSAPEARIRFLREAKAISRLSHPNVVMIHAIETFEDRDFLVMEYVQGVTLDEYISRRERPIKEIVEIGIQLCRGLQHAHAAGVIHRDLKPANIKIDADGQVRILDFGLAQLKDESSSRLLKNPC